MSYKALLFCPDDKTARVVTQVLSELEFQVERCDEPFAAVKKLMAEHFDAVVVDGDNDQNATLLFKGARNSASNQTSLSVAVVEGQSGVAQAFRIGANLVLTKPINVEQSKGTLRVARGLLRKTDFTRPAGPSPGAVRPVVSADFQRPPASEIPAPRPAITSLPAQPPPSVIPMASASVLEVEKEPEPQPEPAEAALLESMPDPIGIRSRGSNPAIATGSNDSPWPPISKPAAGPMASIGDTASGRSQSSGSRGFGSARGTATATAPARDVPRTEVRTTAAETEPPLFSSFAGLAEEPASGSGVAKKILIAAVVLLAAAGAGYVGWTRTHPGFSLLTLKQPAPAQTAPVQTAPAQPQSPASTDVSLAGNSAPNGPSATAESQPVEQVPDITLSTTDSASTADVAGPPPPPSKAAKPSPGIKARQPASSLAAAAETATPDADTKAHEVVVVRNEHFTPVPKPVPAEEPPAPAAGLLETASNANDKTISGIVSAAPTNVPRPAPQTFKVSQGVSQGLLIKKVAPVYPQQALQMRIQGAVEILANIGKDGSITKVKLLSGDAILARAAMDAVKQWKYKAYYLDGQPVDFQTQITVNFKLP